MLSLITVLLACAVSGACAGICISAQRAARNNAEQAAAYSSRLVSTLVTVERIRDEVKDHTTHCQSCGIQTALESLQDAEKTIIARSMVEGRKSS